MPGFLRGKWVGRGDGKRRCTDRDRCLGRRICGRFSSSLALWEESVSSSAGSFALASSS